MTRRYAPSPSLQSPLITPDLPNAALSAVILTSDVDLSKLLSNSKDILRKEISHLHWESSKGKLSPTSARDLVNYLKLLSELELAEKKAAAELSDSELEKIVDETRSDSGG